MEITVKLDKETLDALLALADALHGLTDAPKQLCSCNGAPPARKKRAKVEESKAEEPKVEESKVEEPRAEEPKAEEPKAEEPKAEEPKVEEPKAEEPKAEEPKAEEQALDIRAVRRAANKLMVQSPVASLKIREAIKKYAPEPGKLADVPADKLANLLEDFDEISRAL